MNNYNKRNHRNQKKGMKTWQKRLIAGLVTIFSILVVISLIYGLESILNDKDVLSLHGNVYTWPFQKEVQVENPIGVFGVAVGYVFSYLLGYYFSFIGFTLLLIMSFLFFWNRIKKTISKVLSYSYCWISSAGDFN